MADLDLTAFDPILKSHYVKKRIYALADLKSPLVSMVPRNPKAGGKHIVQPIDFDNPRGGSATFTKAQTNAKPSQYEDFILTRTKNYQVATIDNETILASMQDENAFMPALKEIDKAFKSAGRRDAWQIYRTKGGSKGQIKSTTTLTSTTLILDDKADVFNFQVGELVTFAAADGTGAERDSGDTIVVSKIDRENGEMVMAEQLDTVIAIATGDYIFAEGDFGLNMAGLESWLPVDRSVLTTSFYGVDRSTDEDRLGGIYRDSSAEPLDEAFVKLVSTVGKHGGEPDYGFLNPEKLSDLLLLLEGKGTFEKTKVTGRAQIGFPGVKVTVDGGEVVLMKDVSCKSTRMFVLQMNTWTLHSAGDTPQFLDRDGLLRRSATADSYEVRIGGYRNLGCCAPGYNGVGKLAA